MGDNVTQKVDGRRRFKFWTYKANTEGLPECEIATFNMCWRTDCGKENLTGSARWIGLCCLQYPRTAPSLVKQFDQPVFDVIGETDIILAYSRLQSDLLDNAEQFERGKRPPELFQSVSPSGPARPAGECPAVNLCVWGGVFILVSVLLAAYMRSQELM